MSGYFNMFKICLAITSLAHFFRVHCVRAFKTPWHSRSKSLSVILGILLPSQKEKMRFFQSIHDLRFFGVLRFAFYVLRFTFYEFTSIRTFIVFSRLASMYLYALSY
jgi:hypothetical protein